MFNGGVSEGKNRKEYRNENKIISQQYFSIINTYSISHIPCNMAILYPTTNFLAGKIIND